MDWIDPRFTQVSNRGGRAKPGKSVKSNKRKKTKQSKPDGTRSLASQVAVALAQPPEVWGMAVDHALCGMTWPTGCSAESTLMWSVVMQEQAEVLVRSGWSAKKLASIVAESQAVTAEEKAAQLASVVGLMDHSLESMSVDCLESVHEHARSALALVGVCWHLPEHASRPENIWLSRWLQAVMERLETYEPEVESPMLCHLVMHCELPLLIGLAFSASRRTVLSEATQAMDCLAEYLESSEDNTAPWLAHGATYLRASLATVLRCRVLADALGLRRWYPPQQKALAGLLKHAARWSRPDGTQLLGAGYRSPRAKAIWNALVSQTKRSPSLMAALTLAGVGEGKRREVRKKINPAKLPALTHYSEGASCVCMQADWREKGSRIAVDFSDTNICIEVLGPKGQPLIAGDWTASIEHNGQAEHQQGGWGEVCWFSDEDVDYLEVEAQFGNQARLQRQAALFREERILFVADTLLADDPGTWAMQSKLPLAPECEFESAKKTTEGFIKAPGGTRCLTLPLFLPEWRRQLTLRNMSMSLATDGEEIVATVDGETNRLFMATCIQLLNSHKKQQFTWRQLSVGEDLRNVDAHEALAYRVQIGQEQLIIYRSLTPATRRTALGMHTLADFYVGRFSADDGEVDTVIEVEACETD